MARIVSFVFLDLETSGLPQQDGNKTKITEISFIAVKRCHILETQTGASPRVQQKLTLCLNPRRLVYPSSTDVTDLCNDQLEHESPFDRAVFDTINSFLNLLSKPVCLISQNGITFDFPILKKHLVDLGVRFSDDLLCADSLHGFYDILKREKNVEKEIAPGTVHVQETAPGTVAAQATRSELTPEAVTGVDELDLIFHQANTQNMQRQNESTPSKSIHKSSVMRTPIKVRLSTNHSPMTKVRRKIFYMGDPKPMESYKLKAIYERLLKRPCIKAHRAENDCLMVLECAVAKAKEFVEWIEGNHCLFAEVIPMTVGNPLGY